MLPSIIKRQHRAQKHYNVGQHTREAPTFMFSRDRTFVEVIEDSHDIPATLLMCCEYASTDNSEFCVLVFQENEGTRWGHLISG